MRGTRVKKLRKKFYPTWQQEYQFMGFKSFMRIVKKKHSRGELK